MPYFIIFLIVVFFLAGAGLVFFAIKEGWAKVQVKSRLVHTTGVVHTVERKRPPSSEGRVKEQGLRKPTWMFFPVIAFQLPSVESVTFKSETGDSGHQSKFSAGQQVPVVYDPLGEMTPMLDTWFAMWGLSLSMLVGGVLFMGAAIMLHLAFGLKIFG